MRHHRPARQTMRGLTLIELLIGLVLGLLIVAAATGLTTGQLRENRSLTVESRLMQELRTTADIVTRDLRRAGYWAGATAGLAAGGGATPGNPYTAVEPSAAAANSVSFRYSRDTTENNLVDSNEQFGFRLRNGVIEMQLGANNWQALTDANSLTVIEFNVTPRTEDLVLQDFCTQACPAASSTCPPRQQVRSLVVLIAAQASADARIERRLQSEVRLRNDAIIGACPA
jgi:prepilin peptidase dependent protein B